MAWNWRMVDDTMKENSIHQSIAHGELHLIKDKLSEDNLTSSGEWNPIHMAAAKKQLNCIPKKLLNDKTLFETLTTGTLNYDLNAIDIAIRSNYIEDIPWENLSDKVLNKYLENPLCNNDIQKEIENRNKK